MIYVFLANGFEEIEAVAPIDLLRRCELEVVTAGVGGKAIRGAHGITIAADVLVEDITLGDDIDMIVLPGGMPGTLNLEHNRFVQSVIDYCVAKNKLIGAICAAPSILGNKGLLEGKEATCFPGFEVSLKGARMSDKLVCVDGNIITAKGAGVAIPFALKLVEMLCGKERANTLKAGLQCE